MVKSSRLIIPQIRRSPFGKMTIWRKVLYNLAYYRRPPWDTGRVPPEVEEFLRDHPPGRALDVGCGSGTSSIALAQAGWTVTGMDLAPRAIQLARRKARAAGVDVHFQVADFLRFPINPSAYDLVLDIGCFHGLPRSQRVDYLHKVERLLIPGGFWLLYAFLEVEGEGGKWLRSADLELAALHFRLAWRKDGMEAKSQQPSAWFLFQKEVSTR